MPVAMSSDPAPRIGKSVVPPKKVKKIRHVEAEVQRPRPRRRAAQLMVKGVPG